MLFMKIYSAERYHIKYLDDGESWCLYILPDRKGIVEQDPRGYNHCDDVYTFAEYFSGHEDLYKITKI